MAWRAMGADNRFANMRCSARAASIACFLLWTFLLACLGGSTGAEGRVEVVNTAIKRKIDVSTQFAKVTDTLFIAHCLW